MKIKGWDLDFFSSGEWQVCDERLRDIEKLNRPVCDGYNPGRQNLFQALRCTPEAEVKVMFIGQDPYPSRAHSTGLAFDIPGGIDRRDWPPTLRTILTEYSTDLGLPIPSSGSLVKWSQRGVLLWNAIPSTLSGKSLSHDWPEWDLLTKEIVQRLARKGIAYALLGSVASRYTGYISSSNNYVIRTCHPSPRASAKAFHPFVGSRIFSNINAGLCDLALSKVEWDLEH